MWNKIKSAVTTVANAVANVVNKAADSIADVVETTGNAVSGGLTTIGGKIGGQRFFGWLGGAISGATGVVGAWVKGVGSVFGGLASGAIKIIGGILTLDWRGIVRGFGDIASGISGALLLFGGAMVAFGQQLIGIGRPRPMNERERQLVEMVFRRSLATYNIRVVDGDAGLFSVNGRAFTLGDVIYMKGDSVGKNPSVFIHECVHVWQSQHVGSRYAAEALYAQFWGDGYDWEAEAIAGMSWGDFQREPQGQCIQDIFDRGNAGRRAHGNGSFFEEEDEALRSFKSSPAGVDWTVLANEATRMMRGARPWRLSRFL